MRPIDPRNLNRPPITWFRTEKDETERNAAELDAAVSVPPGSFGKGCRTRKSLVGSVAICLG